MPTVSGFANQRRQVIQGMPIERRDGLISQAESGVAGEGQVFRLEEQVEVSLIAEARIGGESRAMAETLEHDEFDRGAMECGGGFLTGFLDASPPERVVRQV